MDNPYSTDIDLLERDLNHLESLGLINTLDMTFNKDTQWFSITTKRFLLDFFVKCNGSSFSNKEYFPKFCKNLPIDNRFSTHLLILLKKMHRF